MLRPLLLALTASCACARRAENFVASTFEIASNLSLAVLPSAEGRPADLNVSFTASDLLGRATNVTGSSVVAPDVVILDHHVLVNGVECLEAADGGSSAELLVELEDVAAALAQWHPGTLLVVGAGWGCGSNATEWPLLEPDGHTLFMRLRNVTDVFYAAAHARNASRSEHAFATASPSSGLQGSFAHLPGLVRLHVDAGNVSEAFETLTLEVQREPGNATSLLSRLDELSVRAELAEMGVAVLSNGTVANMSAGYRRRLDALEAPPPLPVFSSAMSPASFARQRVYHQAQVNTFAAKVALIASDDGIDSDLGVRVRRLQADINWIGAWYCVIPWFTNCIWGFDASWRRTVVSFSRTGGLSPSLTSIVTSGASVACNPCALSATVGFETSLHFNRWRPEFFKMRAYLLATTNVSLDISAASNEESNLSIERRLFHQNVGSFRVSMLGIPVVIVFHAGLGVRAEATLSRGSTLRGVGFSASEDASLGMQWAWGRAPQSLTWSRFTSDLNEISATNLIRASARLYVDLVMSARLWDLLPIDFIVSPYAQVAAFMDADCEAASPSTAIARTRGYGVDASVQIIPMNVRILGVSLNLRSLGFSGGAKFDYVLYPYTPYGNSACIAGGYAVPGWVPIPALGDAVPLGPLDSIDAWVSDSGWINLVSFFKNGSSVRTFGIYPGNGNNSRVNVTCPNGEKISSYAVSPWVGALADPSSLTCTRSINVNSLDESNPNAYPNWDSTSALSSAHCGETLIQGMTGTVSVQINNCYASGCSQCSSNQANCYVDVYASCGLPGRNSQNVGSITGYNGGSCGGISATAASGFACNTWPCYVSFKPWDRGRTPGDSQCYFWSTLYRRYIFDAVVTYRNIRPAGIGQINNLVCTNGSSPSVSSVGSKPGAFPISIGASSSPTRTSSPTRSPSPSIMSPSGTPTPSLSPTGAATLIPSAFGLFNEATRYITITSANAAGRVDPTSITHVSPSLGFLASAARVRRLFNASSAPLTIDEVVVLDTSGINVALSSDVNASSTADGFDARFTIDGAVPTLHSQSPSMVWRSNSSGEADVLTITFPASTNVSSISIFGVANASSAFSGAVELLDRVGGILLVWQLVPMRTSATGAALWSYPAPASPSSSSSPNASTPSASVSPLPREVYRVASAAEGSNMTLACPTGSLIYSVPYASFGTPNVSALSAAADFVRASASDLETALSDIPAPSCNATSSFSVVSEACVGKASCNVSASNSSFSGDTCIGSTRQLAALATCVSIRTPGQASLAISGVSVFLGTGGGRRLTGINIASGASVFMSSTFPGHPASAALDGDPSTFALTSIRDDPANLLMIDFGADVSGISGLSIQGPPASALNTVAGEAVPNLDGATISLLSRDYVVMWSTTIAAGTDALAPALYVSAPFSMTATMSSSATASCSQTSTATPSTTPSSTLSSTSTGSVTAAPSRTPPITRTSTPSRTAVSTASRTRTETPSATSTGSPSSSQTGTPGSTQTGTSNSTSLGAALQSQPPVVDPRAAGGAAGGILAAALVAALGCYAARRRAPKVVKAAAPVVDEGGPQMNSNPMAMARPRPMAVEQPVMPAVRMVNLRAVQGSTRFLANGVGASRKIAAKGRATFSQRQILINPD